MNRKNERIAVLVAPWLLAASLPAVGAGMDQWGVDSCAGPAAASGSATSTVYASCTDAAGSPSGPSLTYTAISNTGGTGGPGGGTLAGAYVGNYGGDLGITSRAGTNSAAVSGGNSATQQETTNPAEHALDNVGNFEMMLLTFGGGTTDVALNMAKLGYVSGDSDISVLAYKGTGAPTLSGTATYAGLAAAGWKIVGNYSNVPVNTATNVNTGVLSGGNLANTVVSSSYWLIGAYNSVFGGSGMTTGDDYVKLLAIYGTPGGAGGSGGGVPEPSSLLLAGIALFGLTVLRRRAVI